MTARPSLDAVVFDAGGTLVRIDFEWMAETAAGLGAPVAVSALRRGEIEGRRRYDASRGRGATGGEPSRAPGTAGDTRAYFRGLLEAGGVPAGVIAAMEPEIAGRQAAARLWGRPVEGARETLARLRAMGLRMAAVSNSDGRAEQHLVDCGVREGLEFVVDSEIVGIEKPDPGIFAIALERLGLPAGRTLYVGDILSVDEAGSRAAGMHFTLIDPFGDYAPAGVSSVSEIAELPEHLRERFHLPAGANAPAASVPNRAVP